MQYRKRLVVGHEFYCTQCGKRGIPVCRSRKGRGLGHLKKLFCLNCNRVTNHAECVSGTRYDKHDFMREFEAGNFDVNGMRIVSLPKVKKRKVYKHHKVSKLTNDEWMALFQNREDYEEIV